MAVASTVDGRRGLLTDLVEMATIDGGSKPVQAADLGAQLVAEEEEDDLGPTTRWRLKLTAARCSRTAWRSRCGARGAELEETPMRSVLEIVDAARMMMMAVAPRERPERRCGIWE